jgi:hypothetical protein
MQLYIRANMCRPMVPSWGRLCGNLSGLAVMTAVPGRPEGAFIVEPLQGMATTGRMTVVGSRVHGEDR